MKKLVEAFTIFSKYTDSEYPTICEHDTMYVVVNPEVVSDEDLKRLEEIGFDASYEDENFQSTIYGSC